MPAGSDDGGASSDGSASAIAGELVELMATLRGPKGCPWDRAQSFATIAPYTIEEAYEVADAITQGDMSALRDELGDLLFQVVFHARMAEEVGSFDFQDVARGLIRKMHERHPHVFGEAVVSDAAGQAVAWESIKAAERTKKAAKSGQKPSALDGVPLALPALMRAAKLQKRAARIGFDWPSARDVLDKVREEIDEIIEAADTPLDASGPDSRPERLADEVGDLLFAVANLARHYDVDPEAALRAANAKFERRFRAMERELGARAGAAPLDEMEQLWRSVKAAERARPK
ncbi:MAG: nucleoside triphosphate pyrophosphohydrolase [Alphaproteobacteria bacterium]|nr:nucleoside triphosphate pyrophosphohydrolase [Alphaproteobacteria bacterium]